MAQESARCRYKLGLVVGRASGRKDHRVQRARDLSACSRRVRRKNVRGPKGKFAPNLRRSAQAWTEYGERCESLSVPDSRPALSQTRFCADQTCDTDSNRYGLCVKG